MVSTKIKALLNLSGKDHAGLASYLGISKQALSNKFYRDSFSGAELIKIAEYNGCSLSFVFNDGNKVVLDKGDIKEEPAK